MTFYDQGTVRRRRIVSSNRAVFSPAALPVDGDLVAWVAAVNAAGGSVSPTRQALVGGLIGGLKADNLWTKYDRIWLDAGENTQSALIDIVKRTTAIPSGGPSFTVDRGYTGVDQSASVFIDTGYNPSVNGSAYTVNSAHFSVWSTTNIGSVGNGGCMTGADDAAFHVLIGLYCTLGTDGNVYGRINDATESGAQGVPTTRAGHWVVNRTGANASQIYQNGNLFASPNAAASAGIPATDNLYVLASEEHGAGTAFGGNPNQIALTTIGAGFSPSEITLSYARFRSYMSAVGVP